VEACQTPTVRPLVLLAALPELGNRYGRTRERILSNGSGHHLHNLSVCIQILRLLALSWKETGTQNAARSRD
jgi:hypothetical protein